MKSLILSLTFMMSMTNLFSAPIPIPENEIINAYIYGFPLVLMDVTKNVLTNTPTLTQTKAPLNQLFSKKTFPDPSFTEVVSPNADTLYTQAWLDLTKEPMILSVPDMGDRYYLFPMLDEWSNVFFSPGTRTTGNKKGNFAITGPNWKGILPNGVQGIQSPTNFVWIIGRIQTNGSSDFAAVNKLQEQFKLTPLSAWKTTNYRPISKASVNSNIDSKTAPVEQVLKMDGVKFFKRLAQILKTVPIPKSDTEYVKQFEKFGFVPGKNFDTSNLSAQQVQELNQLVKKAQNKIKENWDKHPFALTVNGWGVITKGIGTYGTNYDVRAAVAYGGLGANLPEDAIYPATNVDSNGHLLNGQFHYVIHFDKGDLPPAKAFWSITMYNDRHFFVRNPLNRYALGDRDQLKFNPDGSLDIYIQNLAPSNDKKSNWLPAPQGNFNLLFRLYEPKDEALNGTWKPPEIKKVR